MIEYQEKEILLKIENLNMSYGIKKILNNIDLEIKDIQRTGVNQGQIVGLLGPSGSGKSTLFNILAGFLEPISGYVGLYSEKTKNLEKPKPGEVGVVQQTYPLFNHRTVENNLLIASNCKTKKEKLDQVHFYLERFSLSHVRKFYPMSLSGGQRQRIAIIQQLLCSNNFLLLDEPFSGLDIISINKLSNLLIDITQSNELLTVIIVSHSIESTAAISDKLLCLGHWDKSEGEKYEGAKIKYIFDLKADGLAWQKDIRDKPEFFELLKIIREKYLTL